MIKHIEALSHRTIAAAIVVALASGAARGAEPSGPRITPLLEKPIAYSPAVERDIPDQVLFGDTHLHTAYSADAGLVGCLRTPDDAYRFARGETVVSSTGTPARLARPLDWLVVTDHAESLGLPIAIATGAPELLATEWGRQISEVAKPGTIQAMIDTYEMWEAAIIDIDNNQGARAAVTGLAETFWHKITAAADSHYEPGQFTTFIGYEWTLGPGGSNLHRNVIFRDGSDRANQVFPLSAYDTGDPQELWRWMENYERDTGGRVMALAHNGNLSNGLMFDDVTLVGQKPLDADYARRRMRWEPLYEVTQIKGDGEAHPLLSPDDEFADFGTWDNGSFGSQPKTPDMLPREYARSALMRGLSYSASLGVNPFKFGMVGSTDSHTALSTAAEDNFFGKVTGTEPGSPFRFSEPITGRTGAKEQQQTHAMALASGLAAVWARDNTREAIFDAFQRKEVYATTGTRLQVRLFGGFDFVPADLDRADFAEYGYSSGVPMGGDLAAAPAGKAPAFLVYAARDPDGANLDRLQIIKGWLDEDGKPRERVFDVALADGRAIGADGRGRQPVGDTVDVAGATWSNSIGDPQLQAYWRDPEFDPNRHAFYYVRVIEIPTPRWPVYDAKRLGTPLPEGLPTSIQERAYTSPIWYSPPAQERGG